MARKALFFKAGTTFYADPATVTKEVRKASQFDLLVVRLLNRLGVPVTLDCCDPGDRVPIAYNRVTGQDEVFVNGVWVPVENAAGATITSTTTTLP